MSNMVTDTVDTLSAMLLAKTPFGSLLNSILAPVLPPPILELAHHLLGAHTRIRARTRIRLTRAADKRIAVMDWSRKPSRGRTTMSINTVLAQMRGPALFGLLCATLFGYTAQGDEPRLSI